MSEQHETEVLHREFDIVLRAGGDGRTLEGRVVPFGEVATVSDGGPAYREEFLPGAFKAQLSAPNRVPVWLNFQHEQGIRGIIGNGVQLQEKQDGLYGTFRVHANADGEKALQLFHEGLATKLSGEFVARRSVQKDGVVQRVDARLVGTALVPQGAYPSAEVLAVREKQEAEQEVPVRVEPLPPFNPELAEKMKRFTAVPPELQAPVDFDAGLAAKVGKYVDVPNLLADHVERQATMAAEMGAVDMLKEIIPFMERYIENEPDAADQEAMRQALAICRDLLAADQEEAAA